MTKPEDSRSLPKDFGSNCPITKAMKHSKHADEALSLIAFVQKHRLEVKYDSYFKVWKVGSSVYYPAQDLYDYMPGKNRFIEGKTWIAAVRKAKRVIDGSKK